MLSHFVRFIALRELFTLEACVSLYRVHLACWLSTLCLCLSFYMALGHQVFQSSFVDMCLKVESFLIPSFFESTHWYAICGVLKRRLQPHIAFISGDPVVARTSIRPVEKNERFRKLIFVFLFSHNDKGFRRQNWKEWFVAIKVYELYYLKGNK